MNKIFIVLRVVLIIFLYISMYFNEHLFSQWTQVVPGIEYRKFTSATDGVTPSPNNVFVTRMLRSQSNLIIDVGDGLGKIRYGRETVSNNAKRYENVVNHKGEQYDVVACINGGFFDYTTGRDVAGFIMNGSYVDSFVDRAKLVFNNDRTMMVDTAVTYSGKITFVDNSTATINDVNVARGADQMILYTFNFDSATFTNEYGCEVIVGDVHEPIQCGKDIVGVIKEIRPYGQSSAPIPFDGFVLSGHGVARTLLESKCSVGDPIKIRIDITSSAGKNWSKAYCAIEGRGYSSASGWLVKDGQPNDTSWEERHPRTVVGYNNTYVYFIVCDGRAPGVSIGMTFKELIRFCTTYLNITDAINLDGGGSSTLWVDGFVKNNPSDGSERSVATTMFMATVSKTLSSKFATDDVIKATNTTNVYLGPGTQFGILTPITINTTAIVSSSPINGVYAKGYYWWKVKYNTKEGWVREENFVKQISTITVSPPILVSIANNATNVVLNPLFDWNPSSGALTYRIQIDDNSDFSSPVVDVSNLTSTDYSVSSGTLNDSTKYYWRVCAIGQGGITAWSNTWNFTTIYTLPFAPSNFAGVVISSVQINLSWTDNSTNETGFKIDRKTEGGSYSLLTTVNANVVSYNNTGLTPATTYYYRVYAYNSAGNSSYSSEIKLVTLPASVSVTLPTAPSNLTGIAISTVQISLSWTDNSTNETGFKIERKTEGGNYNLLTTLGANSKSYVNSGLTPATTYYYRVYAYNSAGNSNYSNEVRVITFSTETQITLPLSPSNLIGIVISSNQIILSWSDNSTNETGFKIERMVEGESYKLLTTVGSNIANYNDKTVKPDTQYSYRIYAYNNDGNSGYSNEVTVKTYPEDIHYLSEIEHSPIEPVSLIDPGIKFTTIITDEIGVRSAKVYYRAKGANGEVLYDWVEKELYDTGDNIWTATLIKEEIYPETKEIEYRIVAENGSGSNSSEFFSFKINDRIEKTIGITGGDIVLPDGNPDDGECKIEIPYGVLGNNTTFTFQSKDRNMLPSHQDRTKVNNQSKPLMAYEIVTNNRTEFKGSIILKLLYLDINNDGYEDNSGIDERKLRIWWYDDNSASGEWRYLGGTVDTAKNIISVRVNHLSIYGIYPTQNLTGEMFRPKERILMLSSQDNSSKVKGVIFSGIQNVGVGVKIYDLRGRRIRELTSIDIWDGKDEQGNYVPSGVYIYQYRYEGQKYQGSIVVGR